jgi:antitoxin (DNA-binding transcriptional repressor) of toxin-antitoxin stability system
MGTTHIPVAEAAKELPELLARVRSGEDIVIDDGTAAPIRLAPAATYPRSIPVEQVIAHLEQREIELGHPLRMDAEFADAVEERIRNRKPRGRPEWD